MQITHAFLKELELQPRKSLGQYLLVDEQVVKDIVSALSISRDDDIVEVGSGIGVLTSAIINEFKRFKEGRRNLTAVEIDKRYSEYLKKYFHDENLLKVVNKDVLKFRFNEYFNKPVKVAGNIPYYISSPLLRMLFDNHKLVSMIVIMLQKEVGLRVFADPKNKKYSEYYGLLSIMRKLHYDAEIIRTVGRNSFLPVPDVDSIVIRLKVHEPILEYDEEKILLRILKPAFSARRKMLKNALKSTGTQEEIKKWSDAANIDLNDRIENIDLGRLKLFLKAYVRDKGKGSL